MVRKFLVTNSSSDGVWSVWTGTNAEWNEKVADIEGLNVYQSAQWADHKANAGWQTLRFVKVIFRFFKIRGKGKNPFD